ncbi:MAG: hypothetical protein L0332_11810 [Chloroflexi bacterium]|nr:hypothetical protein [Chloroflexota bacterium]MCI0576685.1 hypothetical protein [Chloroflexota bacterium]MCI0647998.1 hypothetical protein [Chloroflexota bacterium]MCI0727395.1 hypothetical protein [Chloroflexota bacterium]
MTRKFFRGISRILLGIVAGIFLTVLSFNEEQLHMAPLVSLFIVLVFITKPSNWLEGSLHGAFYGLIFVSTMVYYAHLLRGENISLLYVLGSTSIVLISVLIGSTVGFVFKMLEKLKAGYQAVMGIEEKIQHLESKLDELLSQEPRLNDTIGPVDSTER